MSDKNQIKGIVSVIGFGMSFDDIPQKHLDIISNSDVIAGGARHLSFFEGLDKEKITIKGKITTFLDLIKKRSDNGLSVSVLASGDPFFYGIGNLVKQKIGSENIEIYPNINSVSAAFSKIKEPWDDAEVLSFHGRNFEEHAYKLLCGPVKKGIFTDPDNSPDKIAGYLLASGFNDSKLCVLENMGDKKETIGWYTPKEAAEKKFENPNFLILYRNEKDTILPWPGMPEDDFSHQNGLITKTEIRLVSIARLRLFDGCTFWDIGAGSGSVSIEASITNKSGKIISVEKIPERVEDIRKNKVKFGVSNLEIVSGAFHEVSQDLPAPDRVFIGGGGKELGSIISRVAEVINEKGIIVVNTVLLKNLSEAMAALENEGFETEVTQIQVSREKKMPWDRILKAFNPVWIIAGKLKK